jgi:predicted NAD/FAD-binding protein
VTVWMNRIDEKLRAQLSATVFQTWNPERGREPKKEAVLADYAFDRPVVTKASVAAMRRLAAYQGRGHVWFVGAYSLYSMPLLENGVKSAMTVARALGVDTSDVEFNEEAATAAVRSGRGSVRSPRSLAVLLVFAAVGLTGVSARYFA